MRHIYVDILNFFYRVELFLKQADFSPFVAYLISIMRSGIKRADTNLLYRYCCSNASGMHSPKIKSFSIRYVHKHIFSMEKGKSNLSADQVEKSGHHSTFWPQ